MADRPPCCVEANGYSSQTDLPGLFWQIGIVVSHPRSCGMVRLSSAHAGWPAIAA